MALAAFPPQLERRASISLLLGWHSLELLSRPVGAEERAEGAGRALQKQERSSPVEVEAEEVAEHSKPARREPSSSAGRAAGERAEPEPARDLQRLSMEVEEAAGRLPAGQVEPFSLKTAESRVRFALERAERRRSRNWPLAGSTPREWPPPFRRVCR